MIAVYYYMDSAPETIIVLDVKDKTKRAFIKAMIGEDHENHEYPWPSADVIILENENVIAQFHVDERDKLLIG